ncbi:MAG: AraC family transcriptional regulator [Planctomycetota bacterium]|nr:AraC family transcriptional regulator [Planctomycetota bacterium]
MSPVERYLRRLLSARISITHVQVASCAAGFRVAERVVPTPRLLLARAGSAQYAVEGRAFRFGAPGLLWVAAGARRGWRVPRGGRFDVSWVEYDPVQVREDPRLGSVLRAPADLDLESAAFTRLLRMRALDTPAARLEAEGELKALLARFFLRAAPGAGARAAQAPRERGGFGPQGIERAVAWLEQHFRRPDALRDLPARAHLSPNHFRLLFKRRMGLSAQAYVTALRMRAARAFLQETDLPVKQVARAVGYEDPLYFSRLYRGFWKRSPSEDRVFSP